LFKEEKLDFSQWPSENPTRKSVLVSELKKKNCFHQILVEQRNMVCSKNRGIFWKKNPKNQEKNHKNQEKNLKF
jgi:hypothetical protein